MCNRRIVLILICVVTIVSCGPHLPQTEPGQAGFYHSLNIKLNVRLHQEKRKGSGRILWFFDTHRGKMLFLSPLNQIYFELLVEGEDALLISRKEKKYWKGSFSKLLRRLWNLNVRYNQLLALVNEGKIPAKTGRQKPLIFNINKGRDTGQPSRIEIESDDVSLILKISSKKTRQGQIKFIFRLDELQRVGIDDILSLQY